MGASDRLRDRAARKARAMIAALGVELRTARVDRGLSQAAVARAAGLSQTKVSRMERGLCTDLALCDVSRALAVVGLDFSGRAYPGGSPIRDHAHTGLLRRLKAVCSPMCEWRHEVPLPEPGDLRAWDATCLAAKALIGVEAEMRPRDCQALVRRVNLKQRDDPRVAHVILLLADTRSNRHFIREHADVLRSAFPLGAAEILDALRAGHDPGGSGIVLL